MSSDSLNIKRLIECRKKMGITKQEAAKRMQMSQPAYVRYESGERTPSIHIIRTMADVLCTSAAYLTNQTDDPNPDSYIIRMTDEPALYKFVETFRNSTNDVRNRMIAYMRILN